jgi:hypothetical protein
VPSLEADLVRLPSIAVLGTACQSFVACGPVVRLAFFPQAFEDASEAFPKQEWTFCSKKAQCGRTLSLSLCYQDLE